MASWPGSTRTYPWGPWEPQQGCQSYLSGPQITPFDSYPNAFTNCSPPCQSGPSCLIKKPFLIPTETWTIQSVVECVYVWHTHRWNVSWGDGVNEMMKDTKAALSLYSMWVLLVEQQTSQKMSYNAMISPALFVFTLISLICSFLHCLFTYYLYIMTNGHVDSLLTQLCLWPCSYVPLLSLPFLFPPSFLFYMCSCCQIHFKHSI